MAQNTSGTSLELPRLLSAKYTTDYAYPTIKDRVPVILTKVIDQLYQMRNEVLEKHGQEGAEQLKTLTGKLSQLRNEIQTNKMLVPIVTPQFDIDLWNNNSALLYEPSREVNETEPQWFESPWLLTECYFYRRVHEAVQQSSILNYFDVFEAQKTHGLVNSLNPMILLTEHLSESCVLDTEADKLQNFFTQFLKVELWGNKCDLSISAGQENYQKQDAVAQLPSFEPNLLVDASEKVWQKLLSTPDCNLHIILDNSGFEFFSDLCLAEFLTFHGVVKTVHFHGKAMPWFVSDVTQEDVDSTLNYLKTVTTPDGSTLKCEKINALAQLWNDRFSSGVWSYSAHKFWTSQHPFTKLETLSSDLHKQLSDADLLIFKGDLNYRKLTGDRSWDFLTDFETSLCGFKPTSLCALRTIKCDTVVGLSEGQAKKAHEDNGDGWMLAGDFAVIQYVDK